MSISNLSETIPSIIERRVIDNADKIALRFIISERESRSLTYSAFYKTVLSYAAYLQREAGLRPEDRVLILYPPGLDYICAFYACLFAGIIAVPAYPPDSKNNDRVIGILKDCRPAAILTGNPQDMKAYFSGRIISFPDLESGTYYQQYTNPGLRGEDIVFLQYTSGSVSIPKGVILTHANLVENCRCIVDAFGMNADSEAVSWLPPYHDMGLIGTLISPLYLGITTTQMSPFYFVKKPLRWLQVITNAAPYEVISPAPNFGYELCTNSISEEMLYGLNLSHWRNALCGAEPIRFSTYEKFSRKFHTVGFRRSSFIPVYGLAEATLLFSGKTTAKEPLVGLFDPEEIKHNRISIVDPGQTPELPYIHCLACGPVVKGHEALIVQPETSEICGAGTIGEIWIRGKSIAKGYWNNTTDNRFHSFTLDGKGPFFRTGDLGFIREGLLYITGRLKDCLIVNGKNYYPQDIEFTVSNTDELLRKDGTAVFTVAASGENDPQEKIVVVQELNRIKRKAPVSRELFSNIRQNVLRVHGIIISEVVLIEASAIPRTSSGKIMRHKVKEMYEDKALKVVDLSGG
ncbi:fatty acyl-AMP ligase [Chitinophaga sp. Mgbs1]|uniref:Fatty acyl-AMP ligase n=1 Tax=Chitinophaga solisilvae TaxID=1233460 RepID=A0A433WDT4_9BACT|nr:fatty acyl-AMP ligase [Chitinophaga solisilvae]